MAQITCDIVNLKRRVYRNKECQMVVVPGKAGEMGFMAGHVPTLTKLTDGAIRAHLDDGTVATFASQGGYAYCTGSLVYILADRSCSLEEIDLDEIKSEREKLEKRFKDLEQDSIDQKVVARKIRWCNIREKVKTGAGASL